MPTVLIFSKSESFRSYVRTLLPEGGRAVEVQDDAACLEALRLHPDAVVVLDVHSVKPACGCESLAFLMKMCEAGFDQTRVILLTWFTPEFIFRHTRQNSYTNSRLLPRYDERLYYFRRLPIPRSELQSLLQPLT